jgi:hypothetical protein
MGGDKMRGIKIERRNNVLALGGHCFIFRHNNQPMVRGRDGSYYGEDAQPGRSVWGGVVSSSWAENHTMKQNRERK